ncbi:CAP-Gly domain-containing linker protein 4-like isoform X1 [Ylistrum balloti]|uniref:CAP-Gly domain-containing linker protein 4-like isoform X1 n=1 Tax=Ylistrum balloti TaxID=509963 RepID=UPI0029058F9D|nr:CAP-Gly domain-containing linker protein 4-like isoform X1 [Ylistrum balloti]XP_060081448.1 CAP-Gly domain-containing linker protein 4-like isoform X1 [Ylistrum balloti]
MTLEAEEEEEKGKDINLHLNNNGYHPDRDKPMIHPCVDPPVCDSCQKLELSFFDPGCPGCHDILVNPNTTVPEIFAVLRQWTPQTQQNLELLINEILKRNAHINDRDGLTDMTLLQYASKSGAAGIGDPEVAAGVVTMLISKGADVNIRCRWTNMTALHYAAYFDVVPVIKVLLKTTKALDIDSTCSEFDHGSSLHIAASNLAYEAVKVLLQNGANPMMKDDMGRGPIECIPDPTNLDSDPEMAKLVVKLKKTLQESCQPAIKVPPPNYDLVQSKVTLQALGITLGDKVVVGGVKTGTLKYCGPAEFAGGLWAGIELDEPGGKNDGSVGGISYFQCANNHGIFAPVSKIAKQGTVPLPRSPSATMSPNKTQQKAAAVNVSNVKARVDTGIKPLSLYGTGLKCRTSSIADLAEIDLGDRVIVAGQRKGTVRFCGEAKFAPGIWYGIELDRPVGKNDGSVNTDRYFHCKPKHGVFAPLSRIQKLGDRRFSSNESLDAISWGAVSEKVDRRASSSVPFSSQNRAKTPIKRPKSGLSLARIPGASAPFKLEVGMSVFCNSELGTVRYIGPADFGDGIWVGVELRTAKGKNDGCVQDKRYFSCKPDHGLLVRPSKITVRGINGSKLVSDYYHSREGEA